MKIKLTSIYVDDQDKALRFYTDVLGFVKQADVSQGPYRWLTVASPEDAPALPVRTSHPVADDDQIQVGTVPLRIIKLVGHTPGSIAVLYEPTDGAPHLFTGDSLFPGGPGRTTNPDDFASLMDDLERKVFGPLPDETWVYPGHGKDTTLGVERPQLAEWRARGW